jgi:hypothetical protein
MILININQFYYEFRIFTVSFKNGKCRTMKTHTGNIKTDE